MINHTDSKLLDHLRDSLNRDGDILISRIYDGTVARLILKSIETDKKLLLIDTFEGLPPPSQHDLQNPNKNEIIKSQFFISESNLLSNLQGFNLTNTRIIKGDLRKVLDKKICFMHVDLKQYQATHDILFGLWDNMAYGGTIFIDNFDYNASHSSHLAVKKFLANKNSEIGVSKQMMINGVKDKFIAIKCYNEKNKPLNWKQIKKSTLPVTIALVLKTGGDTYDEKYVEILRKNIKKNTTIENKVVCLTDSKKKMSSLDRIVTLEHNFEKWWSKIELFKPNLFDTEMVFYFDLDTLIIDNIDDILSYTGNFAGLRDFYSMHTLGSGIMAWKNNYMVDLYRNFLTNSRNFMSMIKEGDQKFINDNLKNIEYIQDAFPTKIISFKKHCYDGNNIKIPLGASIICFHGNPRPHMVQNDPNIKKYWS
jgi:hypothetical protein